MAYTYSKLASYTVGSGGITEVNFLAIPQNYTDLIIKVSARLSPAAVTQSLGMYINNIASDNSYNTLRGSGSTATTLTGSAQADMYVGEIPAASATANVFGNTEIYIPNYTSSNQKCVSTDSVSENNGTLAYTFLGAGLSTKTNPITSLTFRIFSGGSSTLLQYSTFTLYGVKAEV